MSFPFGSSSNAIAGGATGGSSGPDLPTIQTEELGFLSVAGDAKVRLTSSWTNPPTSTSSLLSIASRRGLVAAAGPDYIAFATTESVRKALESPKNGDSDVRNYEPQLKIPMPMAISQLSFTADETYLLLSAENGGGLAVYDVQALLQGSTSSAFELSTGGESLRCLVPNPTVEKSELCAVVTNSGKLHMANLKERAISNPLKTQVSCISWSTKGKQLCAGLADASIYQMTPEGEGKAEIPRPAELNDYHVSSLTWLENNMFLAIYTPNSGTSSVYQIITRQNSTSFTFQKIADPVEPFGAEKAPHHSILRLKDFPPDLQDLLIVASTAAAEVGLLSRWKPNEQQSGGQVTGVFTSTELLDDTKRPTLPMTESMGDSVPVGVALDLSSKETVYRPIPSDEELKESPTPLPGLWILTHEGVLCSWWLVYSNSIKQAQAYPGLAAAASGAMTDATPSQPIAPAANPSPFSAPDNAPFGSTSGGSAFGSAPGGSAFGASSQLGQKSSPWALSTPAPAVAASTGSAPSFGGNAFGSSSSTTPTAAFGKPSALGFGQSSQIGLKTSPWGASNAGMGGAPAFGQSGFSSFANKSNQSAFGSAGGGAAAASPTPSTSASGGFSSFAGTSGFGSLGKPNTGSVFGTGSKPTAASSPFGTSGGDTAFPPKQESSSGGLFGSTPFKLESSFKPDPTVKEDSTKSPGPGQSLFGSAFGSALTESSSNRTLTTSAKDEEMDADEAPEQTPQPAKLSPFSPKPAVESTTPTTTPAQSRFGGISSPAPGASLFGQPTTLGSFSGGLFGSSTTPKQASSIFGQPKAVEPKIKVEEDIEAPLPPDTTSRLAYPLGDSSSSSAASSAPSQPYGATTTPVKPDPAPFPPFSSTVRPTSNIETPALPSDLTKSNNPAEAPLPPNPFKPADQKTSAGDPPLPPNPFKPAERKVTDLPNPFKPTERKVADDAPLPPNPFKVTERKVADDALLPPNPFKPVKKVDDAPLPPDPTRSSTSAASSFVLPKAPSKESSELPSSPEESAEEESAEESEVETDLDEENASEGSGVDVAKDLSPNASGNLYTPGYTPQSSFGGIAGTTPATARPGQDAGRTLFGEISRNAPLFGRPSANSPRSPSPIRGAVPSRVIRSEASRSVSAPGMASQILGPKATIQSQLGATNRNPDAVDPFMLQHRKLREKQEAEEAQPLVDEEDDEIQKILASDVEGCLELDEFIAHSNVAPPAKESIPAQVEAVYRDINSMIDTLGLNARTIKAFTKGHTENAIEEGRGPEDLEDADDWVLCEVEDLGDILDNELQADLEDGRVQDLSTKLEACDDLAKDVHRLRAKQEDLKRVIMARMDPDQAEVARSLPLSAEQSAQQNELRREYANFSKLISEAEEALTLLKARIASSAGKGSGNVPTVEAVIRTISKMTTMVEKRSGDVDVLETQLRKIRLASPSREGSPMLTPHGRRSIMMSPESTPSRGLRQSISSASVAFGSTVRATPPRKKVSGFSKEEKGSLMEKRARRQAVLEKLQHSIEGRGVTVWNMEDMD